MKKPVRHKLATTKVEVYRLFNVKDAAEALRGSPDPVVATLGLQIYHHAEKMLQPYAKEQDRLLDQADPRRKKTRQFAMKWMKASKKAREKEQAKK